MSIQFKLWTKGSDKPLDLTPNQVGKLTLAPGQRLQLIDTARAKAVDLKNVTIVRDGQDALIQVDGKTIQTVSQFYTSADVAVFTQGALPDTQLVLSSNQFSGAVFQTTAAPAWYDVTAMSNTTLMGWVGAAALVGVAAGKSGGNSTTTDAALNLTGDTGANTLVGGSGADTLSGGLGNDVLNPGAGSDTVDGGGGTDTVTYAAQTQAVVINLTTGVATGAGAGSDTLIGIENATGGSGADSITGSALANVLNGGAGNDTLRGENGDDTLLGGAGDDVLDGGAGTNTASYAGLTTAMTVNLLTGLATGEGSDTLIGIQNVWGGTASDTLTGDAGNNFLDGQTGNDVLSGGAGNDTLQSDAADTLHGGADNDTYVLLGSGATIEDTGGSFDVVNLGGTLLTAGVYLDLNTSHTLYDSLGGTALVTNTTGDIEKYITTKYADTLVAGTQDISFDAGAGNDLITLGAGSATINGEAGNDTIIGGSGNAVITGGAGADSFVGGSGNETINAGADNDIYLEAAGADSFLGGDGNDTVVFLNDAFVDTLLGGAGVDIVDFSSSVADTTLDLIAQNGFFTLSNGTQTDTFSGFEGFAFGAGNDLGIGNDDANLWYGNNGDDTLQGGKGNDTLYGGNGNDVITDQTSATVGDGADNVFGEAGDDTITMGHTAGANTNRDIINAGSGNDVLVLTGQAYTVDAGSEDDSITLELVTAYADFINAGSGNDTIDGFYGNDTINGGAGDDVVYVYQSINGSNVFNITGVEKLDLSQSSSGVMVSISAQDILDMSTNSSLIVTGDSTDTLIVGISAWTNTGTAVGYDGVSYTHYTQTVGGITATLLVDITGGVVVT